MPGLLLSIFRFQRIPALFLLFTLSAVPADARNPDLSKYPLRLHVLEADGAHRTPRMNPAQSLVCDQIEGMLDVVSPSQVGFISLSGISGDPCMLHPEIATERLLNVGDDDPVFSGAGRGDLVSPPASTLGMSFQYDNCARVRVHPGFTSLPARWKKPGKKLEVLIPSDDIPANDKPLPPVRCSFNVTMHDFVYLLLRDGKLVEVSQDLYRQKPSLRVFLSGQPETIHRRLQEYTVSARPAQ
jgi:hypothetical protein